VADPLSPAPARRGRAAPSISRAPGADEDRVSGRRCGGDGQAVEDEVRSLGEQQRIRAGVSGSPPAPFPITAGLPPVTDATLRGGNPAFQLAAMRDFWFSSSSLVASADDNDARVQQS
jgi:hypothetical protein